MPSISTHLNFTKLLNNKGFNNFDNNYFLLGSIAPDYYIHFYDEKMACISHFKKSIFDRSNLNDFVRFVSKEEFSSKELCYIKGYYTHLWLDNYLFDFGDSLEIDKPEGMEEKNTRQFIKENIRAYDISNIREELIRQNCRNCYSEGFVSHLPTTIEKAVELLETFKNTGLRETVEINIITVVKESNYYKFLENAAKDFLSGRN